VEVVVRDLSYKEVDKQKLSEAVFAEAYRSDLLARTVRWQLAKRRSGTHATKGISDISGTTRKPHKQKGTGRARQGSLRSPQFRGGAVIFGPQVRSHSHDLPKKVRRKALRIALSGKVAAGQFVLFDKLALKSGKTKDLRKMLARFEGRVLCVTEKGAETHFQRAAQNLWHLNILPEAGLNVYDILRHDYLLLEKAAVKGLEDRLL